MVVKVSCYKCVLECGPPRTTCDVLATNVWSETGSASVLYAVPGTHCAPACVKCCCEGLHLRQWFWGPVCRRPWVPSTALHTLTVVMYLCHPGTWETKARGSQVQGHLCQHSVSLKASLGYLSRPLSLKEWNNGFECSDPPGCDCLGPLHKRSSSQI